MLPLELIHLIYTYLKDGDTILSLFQRDEYFLIHELELTRYNHIYFLNKETLLSMKNLRSILIERDNHPVYYISDYWLSYSHTDFLSLSLEKLLVETQNMDELELFIENIEKFPNLDYLEVRESDQGHVFA